MTKVKQTKYFLQRVNGERLYCRVDIAMKIKQGKYLTNEILYHQKISVVWYISNTVFTWPLKSLPRYTVQVAEIGE